ncbi:pyridoxal-dependent decarboxylase [Enterobacter ludwigii]|uniref:pyridoxal phosphate-dependent decarboxylase family protein n=1 Tax=Enterobacter ludwigii TaxID=299767 RepID=UPI002B4BDCA8|nr:pyridoxal-dependent decarboxylase [Enterobacter ludwigii]WRM04104.1 pyridoxal-dependent decarboxylase [Enterobacter ludwigii]
MHKKSFEGLTGAMRYCLWPERNNHSAFESALLQVLRDYFSWHEAQRHHKESDHPVDTGMLDRFHVLLSTLSGRLKSDSIPWPAPGYLAHMNSDIPLPASLAYFAAQLYNPNNVTPEASPVTTELEYELSDDFCRLFGMDTRKGWAHLTSGGHAANYEAIWVARNLKYLPLALAARSDAPAQLKTMAPGTLINLAPARIIRIVEDVTSDGMLNALLAQADTLRKRSGTPGRLYVAEGRHYSWDKCADLLNIELHTVPLDSAFRLDVAYLRDRLFDDLRHGRPIVAVVATAGSTGEGSVDDINAILKLKQECQRRFNGSFFLHVDAAYGGYYRSLLVSPDGNESKNASSESCLLKDDVATSLHKLSAVDTITVDPHKCGYVPYPAGCLVISDRRYSQAVARKSKYFNPSQEGLMDFGTHTLEGARPGAAVAAVWMMHRLLGLHKNGYGALLSENLWAARKLEEAIENAPVFCAYGAQYRFRSLFSPDLGIINFAALPRNGIVDASIINALTRRLIQRPPPEHTARGEPWISSNQVAFHRLASGQSDFSGSVSVVRCCLMTPLPVNHQSDFWRTLLLRLQQRILNFHSQD